MRAAVENIRAVLAIALAQGPEHTLFYDLRIPDDRIEGRPQLVTHIRQEFRFGAVRGLRAYFSEIKLLLFDGVIPENAKDAGQRSDLIGTAFKRNLAGEIAVGDDAHRLGNPTDGPHDTLDDIEHGDRTDNREQGHEGDRHIKVTLGNRELFDRMRIGKVQSGFGHHINACSTRIRPAVPLARSNMHRSPRGEIIDNAIAQRPEFPEINSIGCEDRILEFRWRRIEFGLVPDQLPSPLDASRKKAELLSLRVRERLPGNHRFADRKSTRLN